MTRFGITAAMTAAAITVAGCGQKAGDTTAGNSATVNDMASASGGSAPTLGAGQTFANAAAASDAFEIESSRLAATNGASPAIKSYAARMIAAHTESTAKLKAAASSATAAITPDPTLTADQQQKLAALRAATGADFDRRYVADQKAVHQMTLDTLRAYAASGDVPALKTFAAGLAPTVAAHLNMANSLKV